MAFRQLPDLRQLLFHNPTFSAAQRSIFSTLKQGGCLCLAKKENLTVHITKMINRMRVNTVDVTPSTASLISPEGVSSLRRMTVAGELINPALLPIWMDRLELLNAYGLSEVTQINWRHVMQRGQSPQNIGRPVDSTRSYVVLPGTLRLAAILEPGELCLGGHQLAKAYLNLPEKTQASFIKNPFGPGRLFRTGDMVVTHADGSIEIIGRIDFQVKINGQRVEPGETNCHLQEHPEVYDSCTVSATIAGKKSLVAVVVPRQGSEWMVLANKLRDLLHQQLPSYMVPSYWLRQTELSLNVNGKVDIPQLTRLVESYPREKLILHTETWQTGTTGQELTPIQDTILKVWAQTLSIPQNSIDLSDSFVSLGGTSLEAIFAVSLARKHLLSIKFHDIMLQRDLLSVASASKQMQESPAATPELPFSLLPRDVCLDRSGLENAWPVTPFQESLIADLALGKMDYVYTRVLKLKAVNQDAMKEAFGKVVQKSILLRSTFVEHGRTYLQLIRKKIDLPWDFVDQRLDDYLRHKMSTTIVLGGPFLKITALPTNELIVTAHHALFDFWSKNFIYDDLAEVLQSHTPKPRPVFSNFVRYLQQQNPIKSHAFWHEYLKDAKISKLRYRPGHDALLTGRLEPDLQRISREATVPIGSLIYASWAIVLSSLLMTRDVVFGITLSGRDLPVSDILQMEGPTMTSAPTRVRFSDTDTLETIAELIQKESKQIAEFSHYGLRNILRAAEQSPGLFNTMVNCLIMPSDTARRDAFELIESQQLNFTEYVKLEANMQQPNRFTLSSTLEPDVAQAIINDMTLVLSLFSTEKRTSLKDLKLCTARKESLAIPGKLYQSTNYRLAQSMFESRVAPNGTKTALQNEAGETLTYDDLNRKAHCFALYLLSYGVKHEDVVPLYLDKSLESLIAILGILKAGAAFCPLDPANPPARNMFIINDIAAKVIVTDRTNMESCSHFPCRPIVLQELDLSPFANSKINIPWLQPESLAYIIYTSGSTGTPKGVLINHESVAAASAGMIEATGVNHLWRSLWTLNYVFDGSYYDVFSVLGAGGTLFLASQERVLPNLASLVNSFGVTNLMVTPTIAKVIKPQDVPGLKVLLMGGEPLHSGIFEKWARHIPVYSVYGPTEGTILVTTTVVEPTSMPKNIGREIRSADLYLLDPESNQVIPDGEVGELCIAGPHVARGYLNRPDATKAAFWTDADGKRVYRTGDLARRLPDGQIELFGRKDDQVKINGFRIEVGEIENAIMLTGLVESCVVVAASVHGKKQLTALCQFPQDTDKEVDLQERVQPLLPANGNYPFKEIQANLITLAHYMSPALWLPVAFLPVLPSGKTNRKKLIALVESIQDTEITKYQDLVSSLDTNEFRPAENSREKLLQQAWGSIFGKEPESISVTVGFYSLGGDSISAINLVSSCRKLGYEMTVNDVLAFPTIREQSKRLKALELPEVSRGTEYKASSYVYDELRAAGIGENEVEVIYPCLPGQAEFLTRGHKEDQFWQLLTVRRAPKDFNVNQWRKLVTRLTAMNQILRAMFLWDNKADKAHWIQVILKEPMLDFETVYYDAIEERQHLIETQWNSSFKLGKPFVQYRALISREDGTCDLYIKVDHGMYDGTLLRIFDEQFTAMVRNEMPCEPTQFSDMIKHYMTSQQSRMLAFWSNLLRDHTFHYLREIQDPKVSNVLLGRTGLEANVAAHRHGVTPPIIFQTAYTLLLSVLAGGVADVTYDNLLTGRNVPLDNPQLINGNCANFLPFRSLFTHNTPVKSLLATTQRMFWETTENGMVGLEDIYVALGLDRRIHAAKTMFCFQPVDPPPVKPQGKQKEDEMREHMRWVVVAMSETRMFFNYALMLEVFKDLDGYKFKFQFDGRAFEKQEAEKMALLYEKLLSGLVEAEEENISVGDVLTACGVTIGEVNDGQD